ncbi:XRE family transcriptional regulator [Carnobacterium divergens]|uniref:XRE family transcriptional regulator n=1 Tax=Carnobacterium divergens TaxID=2748 RepID=A0AAW8RBV2_CARDV|nr:XRE family transcriptional regulator [Carnobacterium divergens]MDT1958677.1 XRE family transcriptional regulator [Carnobacterium divergens]MDT1974557.1 XRE family transcriptional regulator [Carnobacterium divergens]
MIRNRLGILMAERGIKISDVYEATKISRSTLTSISQNDSKMIQLETIDSLCNYFSITPNDFFDYAPFILKFDCYISSFRSDAFDNLDYEKKELKSFGNDDARVNRLIDYELDILGESRYTLEIIVKRGEKHYKYLMSVDIFRIDDGEESNAPKKFDLEVILNDQYGTKSFVEEIYNEVSVTFKTQIKNECFDLIETKIDSLQDYANIQQRGVDIFVETPFGDTDFRKTPNTQSVEDLKKKYGSLLYNYLKT